MHSVHCTPFSILAVSEAREVLAQPGLFVSAFSVSALVSVFTHFIFMFLCAFDSEFTENSLVVLAQLHILIHLHTPGCFQIRLLSVSSSFFYFLKKRKLIWT